MKVIVLGYGNPFRQDDGVGCVLAPRIAEWLEERGIDVVLWVDQQLLPEAASDIAEADLALFVDSNMESLPQGFLFEPVEPRNEIEGLNIHSVGPGWILALTSALGKRIPEAWLLSVAGDSFDFEEELTPSCQRRVDEAFEAFTEWWENRFGPKE